MVSLQPTAGTTRLKERSRRLSMRYLRRLLLATNPRRISFRPEPMPWAARRCCPPPLRNQRKQRRSFLRSFLRRLNGNLLRCHRIHSRHHRRNGCQPVRMHCPIHLCPHSLSALCHRCQGIAHHQTPRPVVPRMLTCGEWSAYTMATQSLVSTTPTRSKKSAWPR